LALLLQPDKASVKDKANPHPREGALATQKRLLYR